MNRLFAAVALIGSLTLTSDAAEYTFETFQEPSAIDTLPFGINNKGVVSGPWYPLEFAPEGFLVAQHGFIYTDGSFRTVDAPFPGINYTLFYQVNEAGEIAAGVGNTEGSVGAIYDSRRDRWNILPDPDPEAISSQAVALNDRKQVFGIWADNLFFINNHGWLFEHGQYIFFDVPDASPDWFGTLPNSANNRGDVVGDYYDADGGVHGFIRHPKGKIETIDVPDAAPGLTRTIGINDQGTIVGAYWDLEGNRHGYILKNGHYESFDVPNTANTVLTAINNRGDLTGYGYDDLTEPSFAFVARIRRGK